MIKNAELDADRFNKITEGIIGCAYKVANTLGNGFLEKVYENALYHELRKNGFEVERQKQLKVLYDGVIVGEYTADMVVENQVLIELKAVKNLEDMHVAQCLNYLKATGLKLCLLFNFGCPKLEIRRLVNNF